MHRIFTSFKDIEADLRANVHAVVYKYRTWKDENHRRLLTHQEVWFSHPFALNDPLDVRPEIAINPKELDSPLFLQKLLESAPAMRPELVTDRDRMVAAENQFDILKSQPGLIARHRQEYLSDEQNFDPYGVFSTGVNPLSEKLWRDYADNHSGYCIGFSTVELCRQMNSGYGYVEYSNDPLPFSFINRTKEDDFNSLYYKKSIWKDEEEFRFITIGIGSHSKRLQKFTVETASEVILGCNISSTDEQEILKTLAKNYPKQLPVYKIRKNPNGTLIKDKIR